MGFSYKGSISFGLVYIPVKLEKAVQEKEISFNQLDRITMSRITYIKSCRECDGKPVEQKDIIKGYQYEDGKYVIFDESDFEAIKTKKNKSITIEQFVELDEIDPIYFKTPYYVVPTGGEKAFALLKDTLENENKVGIAKTVIGTKENLVALRVKNGVMLLNTLYFKSEIKASPSKEVNEELTEAELRMAKMLVDNMSTHFDASKYKDEYNERILKAIESKIAGKEITVTQEKTGTITDLMEALKASVENTQKQASKNKNDNPKSDNKTDNSGGNIITNGERNNNVAKSNKNTDKKAKSKKTGLVAKSR